jgi:hypothetical protein
MTTQLETTVNMALKAVHSEPFQLEKRENCSVSVEQFGEYCEEHDVQ